MKCGGRNGSRTRTVLLPEDFKSAVSTIPPHAHILVFLQGSASEGLLLLSVKRVRSASSALGVQAFGALASLIFCRRFVPRYA